MSNLKYKKFKKIDLNDPFFNSLKSDYQEFSDWFNKKIDNDEGAFIFENSEGKLDGFLYLKNEDESLNDITPHLPRKNRLKIGTFKINPHGTRLGERFIKKVFDISLVRNIDEIYVTLFEKHQVLLNLFQKYGFEVRATKSTKNGNELVLFKNISHITGDIIKDYPNTPKTSNRYLIAIYPQWHSRLLPDSILKNEDPTLLVKDTSHTNSIHKIYLTSMEGTENIKRGDTLVIYRTKDGNNAEYSSVATSICVVEDVKNINDFQTLEEFLNYTESYSIFSKHELIKYFNDKKYPIIIKFTYNIALNKRIIRKSLIEDIGIERNQYWGFIKLTEEQYRGILIKGVISENIAIH
ncbi:N-acetyltransferase [Volucribacter amazonae]|uniref:Acetyltransferase n=1 Tax=Volucribacter amazonae TaxID=256731 RepID=A0A9X4SHE1_9PAST|nr:N-acetyltransferase [Volucribacter amazonae]MDG6894552.1 acetyltransferase [Volucribacter amazonae]